MKKLDTRIQKSFANTLSFYKEIGIELIISNEKKNKKKLLETKEDNILMDCEQDPYSISNKANDIEELENSFKNFKGCNLKKTSTNFVRFLGNVTSKLLIIDGPPDKEEDKTGVSFVSNKGVLFEKMLNAIDLNKNDVFVVKCIPWRPPGNRYPTTEEIKTCRPFILNLIRLMKPRIIVCLGEIPTNQILNLNKSIVKVRGKWQLLNSEKINKFDQTKHEFLVLPTLSISHLLIRPDLKKHAWEDMKLLRDKIREIL